MRNRLSQQDIIVSGLIDAHVWPVQMEIVKMWLRAGIRIQSSKLFYILFTVIRNVQYSLQDLCSD